MYYDLHMLSASLVESLLEELFEYKPRQRDSDSKSEVSQETHTSWPTINLNIVEDEKAHEEKVQDWVALTEKCHLEWGAMHPELKTWKEYTLEMASTYPRKQEKKEEKVIIFQSFGNRDIMAIIMYADCVNVIA